MQVVTSENSRVPMRETNCFDMVQGRTDKLLEFGSELWLRSFMNSGVDDSLSWFRTASRAAVASLAAVAISGPVILSAFT